MKILGKKHTGFVSDTRVESQNEGNQSNDNSFSDGLLRTPSANEDHNFNHGRSRGWGRGYGNNKVMW